MAVLLLLPVMLPAQAHTAKAVAAVSVSAADVANLPAQITFRYERAGLEVPHFVLHVQESGTGIYRAQVVDLAASPDSSELVEQEIRLSAATRATVFSMARKLNFFQFPCEYKGHAIANQGTKQLTYTGPDGKGACTYNWSSSRDVQKLTDLFLAIAFTLDEGRKLEMLHAHDRLGLDAEMQLLNRQVQEGKALELENIRGVLQGIADDLAVIHRVRLQAAALLQQAAK